MRLSEPIPFPFCDRERSELGHAKTKRVLFFVSRTYLCIEEPNSQAIPPQLTLLKNHPITWVEVAAVLDGRSEEHLGAQGGPRSAPLQPVP